MYVEVLDHARHDGGGLGRAIDFPDKIAFPGLATEHVFLVRSYSECLLKAKHTYHTWKRGGWGGSNRSDLI